MKNKNIVLGFFMMLAIFCHIHGCDRNSSMNEELIKTAKDINAYGIKNMLDLGANANYQDAKGNTPLHYLTQAIIDTNVSRCTLEFKYAYAKYYLFTSGANDNISNKNGVTAKDILDGRKNIDDNKISQKIEKRSPRWW